MNYTAQLHASLEDYGKGDDLRQIAQDFARFHELGITQ